MTRCGHAVQMVDAFVDGELPPDRLLEIDEHVQECKLCAERVALTRAVQVSTRHAVLDGVQVSRGFADRVNAALAAERKREEEQDSVTRWRPLSWRLIAPIAAAAGMVLAIGATRDTESPKASTNARDTSFASADQLLEELVNYHVRAPAPEVTEAQLLPRLEPAVGVPVHLPLLRQYGARWEGGSVIPVSNQRAASLRYRIDGHRVTVYVFDSERVPLRATHVLEPRVVANAAVFVGTRRGYSIAAIERRGVGYAVATDLDTNESAELVAAIPAR